MATPGVIVTIDASEVSLVARRVSFARRIFRSRINNRLIEAAKGRVSALSDDAPSGTRYDARYRIKVKDSFSYTSPANYRISVTTLTPDKVGWITDGTRPHYIYPWFKQALWWPGLGHPVPWVGPPYTALHPGTKPNDFVQHALDRSSSNDRKIADHMAGDVVSGITGTGGGTIAGFGTGLAAMGTLAALSGGVIGIAVVAAAGV